MEWYWAAALMVGMVLALMALGFPVAVAFLGANAVGVYLFMGGWVGLEQLVGSASDSLSSFILVTVPLFILMGNIFYYSGVAGRVFDARGRATTRVDAVAARAEAGRADR